MNMLAYKQDTIVAFLLYSYFLVIHLVLVEVIFSVADINLLLGWNKWEIMLVMVLAEIVWALMFTFIWSNVTRVTKEFHTGWLDFDLTKPINPVFIMSCRRIHAIDLAHCILYLFLAVFFYHKAQLNFSWDQWLIFGFIMLMSLVLMYSISWNLALITFFSERATALWEFFLNITEINNYPKGIYPAGLRSILLYIFPVFLVVNPVYELMAGTFSVSDFWRIILVAVLFLMINVNMWRAGLERYNSAN